MIINKTGKIVDNLYKLGDEGVPVYLLDGDPPAIFDAGYSILGKLYVKEIQKILGSRHPAYCFISHSHFDHCGAVARFKKSFPSLQIVSSEKAKRIFCRPNAIKLIQKLSLSAEPYISKPGIDPLMYDSFETFEINQTVKDEDRLVLSPGITVRVIETPGHTRDCLSYYIPEKKVLFSSEAIGIADQSGYISSSFLVDYDMYFESMKKFNQNFKSLNTSIKRLKKFKELFNSYKPKMAENLIPLLTYHSKDQEENICRHGKIMTVGSGIFEVLNNEIRVYYSINNNPCNNKYTKEKINLFI